MQEDVDAIGISILSGAHNTVFPKLLELMKANGLGNVLLTGGGIIPEEDMQSLNTMGVGTVSYTHLWQLFYRKPARPRNSTGSRPAKRCEGRDKCCGC